MPPSQSCDTCDSKTNPKTNPTNVGIYIHKKGGEAKNKKPAA